MLSIDEVIAREREKAEIAQKDIVPKEDYHNMPWISKSNEVNMRNAEYHEQLIEWLEELKAIKSDGFTDNLLDMGFTKGYSKTLEELKVIKEMDLSIPQHFTKEQSDWIKKYCINRNKEFYNKALDDFVKFASTMPTVEEEDGTIRPMWLEEMAEQLKEKYNE